MEEEMAALRQ